VHDIELVQKSAIRPVSNLKEHFDSVSEARNEFGTPVAGRQKKKPLTVFIDPDSSETSAPNSIQSL